MATITFDEDVIAPVVSGSSHGGVYTTRGASRRRSSEDVVAAVYDDEKGTLKREGDLKKRQDFRGWTLLWWAFGSPCAGSGS